MLVKLEGKQKLNTFIVYDLTHSPVARVELFADQARKKIQVTSPIGRVL